ncbi:hypothetical protein [Rhizobium bangladeshense]|uniref:hypothetical protein n=1 Tax=Rhizobium bangladeshense TaxID=1138189 RepID=UPI002180BC2F|nr:hypothetical protein [Rhizobium bangladeshense]
MARPEPVNDLDPRLRDHREPIIEFICHPCHRHCALERKLLVKAFGAGASFAVIRRRMQTPEGDKCGAHFPCLSERYRGS